jgi:hypothetical protein
MKPLVVELVEQLLAKGETVTTNYTKFEGNIDLYLVSVHAGPDYYEFNGLEEEDLEDAASLRPAITSAVGYTFEETEMLTLEKFGDKWRLF